MMERKKSFEKSGGILYLVATPIGNLGDFSQRAQEILTNVSAIGCEDTRNSGRLLAHFGLSKPLISCHEHNENAAAEKIIALLKTGNSVAYISDAGAPGISDPGSRLVKKVLAADFPISYIPGASAFMAALLPSGLDTDHFLFYGFLDSRSSRRKKELQGLITFPYTLIFYEAPHRIKATLNDLYAIFGPRKAVIAREISKLHEEYIRGSLFELSQLDEATLIGEMVIVVEGVSTQTQILNDTEIIQLIKKAQADGQTNKDAIKVVSETTGINKNQISSIWYQHQHH